MTVEDFDGNENPVEKKEGSGVLSEAVLETISMLQKKIEELKKVIVKTNLIQLILNY